VHTYALDADTTTYRLRETETVSAVLSGGMLATSAHSKHHYDPTWRVVDLETTYFDADEAHAGILEWQYDMSTGNVTAVRKPEQRAANRSAFTTYVYDAKELFVATTTDPLQHKVGTVYDYGTGALLRTIGPNYCTGGCAQDAQNEERRTQVD